MASKPYQAPHDQADRIAARTVISFLAGTVFVLLTSWAGLGVAFFLAVMSCDESCSRDQPPPGANWAEYSDVGQWTVLGRLGIASVALALTAASLVMSGRRRLALAFVGGHGVVLVPLAVLLYEAGDGLFAWALFLAAAAGLTMALSALGGVR